MMALQAHGPGGKLRREALKLITYARQNCPYFARKLSGLEGDPANDVLHFFCRLPVMSLKDLVVQKIQSGDPYSSRRSRNRDPLVTFQMEHPTETPLYVGFDRSDLQHYADALLRCWTVVGVRRGDKVAIFDYGSSPLSYLASSLFTPYLGKGAADLLGCVPVCNDGVPTMTFRALHILRFVRPRFLFIRADVLHPFASEVERQGMHLHDYLGALVVADNERVLPAQTREHFEDRLRIPLYRVARFDAALFFAAECPTCRLFHTWPDLYHVEVLDHNASVALGTGERGLLVITNWFARVCPSIRFLSGLQGALAAGQCSNGPTDQRLML